MAAHTYTGTRIEGDADLTVNFAGMEPGMELDVSFTGIRDRGGQSYTDLNWQNLPIVNGGFASGAPGDSIEGRFYGPNQGEAGGIFERASMVGGFHTIRSKE